MTEIVLFVPARDVWVEEHVPGGEINKYPVVAIQGGDDLRELVAIIAYRGKLVRHTDFADKLAEGEVEVHVEGEVIKQTAPFA